MSVNRDLALAPRGDWQVTGVVDQLPSLSEALHRFSSSEPGTVVRVEMSGVDAIDACGCQLLLLFRHTLTQRGLAPLFCGISTTLGQTVERLGFTPLLTPTDQELSERV